MTQEQKEYIEKLIKETQKERDLLWIAKLKSNVNFEKGDVEKILKEVSKN